MKTARTVDGRVIKAMDTAPQEAVCPQCGGVVVLRRRLLMNGAGFSYFWRHQRNSNLDCSARSRIVPTRVRFSV